MLSILFSACLALRALGNVVLIPMRVIYLGINFEERLRMLASEQCISFLCLIVIPSLVLYCMHVYDALLYGGNKESIYVDIPFFTAF